MLFKKSFYKEIKEDIKRKILEGELKEGDFLPPEVDLARQYGVSRLTVNRALAELAAEGFVERRQGIGTYVAPLEKRAQARRIGLISMILPLYNEEFMTKLVNGALTIAEKADHYIVLMNSNNDVLRESRLLRTAVKLGSVGVLFFPSGEFNDVELLKELDSKNVAVVTMDRKVGDFPCVLFDNKQGGYEATRYLQQLGLERIAFFRDDRTQPSLDREEGYKKAMIEKNLQPIVFEVSKKVSIDRGGAWIERIVLDHDLQGGVFNHDYLAVQGLNALRKANIPVPEKFKVVGMGGYSIGAYSHPPLTTFAHPMEEMGSRAASIILSPAAYSQKVKIKLPFKLLKRSSA